jgi:hypothetical protein
MPDASTPKPVPSLCPHFSIILTAKSLVSFSFGSPCASSCFLSPDPSLAAATFGVTPGAIAPPKEGGGLNLAAIAAAEARASASFFWKEAGERGVVAGVDAGGGGVGAEGSAEEEEGTKGCEVGSRGVEEEGKATGEGKAGEAENSLALGGEGPVGGTEVGTEGVKVGADASGRRPARRR